MDPTNRRQTLLWLVPLLAVYFAFHLGARALWSPVEGRYAEVAREMVVSGDYVTPRLNGVKYFEKPPLFYWLEALSIKLFGLREWSLRLWPALFAVLGCLAVYGTGWQLFGARAGLLAAGVLATSPLYYALGRVVAVDMTFAYFLSAGLLVFLTAVRRPPGRERRRRMWVFYTAAALATLTKGLLGIVLPVLVIGSWIAVSGQWRILKQVHLLSGIALFALIAAPWHIIVAARNPDFANFYFIHEHFGRYLTAEEGGLAQAWIYIPVLLVGMFPWIVFAPQSFRDSLDFIRRRRRDHQEELFLSLWAIMMFLFFSSAGSRLFTYVLPIFPAVALIVGRIFSQWWEELSRPGRYCVWIAAAAMLLIVAAGLSAPQHGLERYSNWPSLGPPRDDTTVPLLEGGRVTDVQALRPYLYREAAILIVGAAALLVFARRRDVRGVFIALAATTALFLTVVDSGFPLLDDRRSVKKLALSLKPQLAAGDEVAAYHAYYQDLPVYLERLVTVVSWSGELEFGVRVEDASAWMIDDAEFRRRWAAGRPIYVFMPRVNYARLGAELSQPVYLVNGNDYTVVVSNSRASGATH
jgi:4-amino-4-deoxy-L-arabinose transferase-like glycosyltransferase